MSVDSSKSSFGAASIVRSIVVVFGASLVFFAAQFLAALLVAIGFQLFGVEGDRLKDLFDNLSLQAGIGVLFGVIMCGAIYLAEGGGGIKRVSKKLHLSRLPGRNDIQKVIVAFGMYFILFVVLAFAASMIPGFNSEQEQQVAASNPSGVGYAALFVSLIIIAPVVEEIVFRGFMLRRLASYVPPVYAAIISSAVFGLFHLEFLGDNPLNWAAALNTFTLALALSWLYLETKNLWTAIALHAIKNLVAFIVLFVVA